MKKRDQLVEISDGPDDLPDEHQRDFQQRRNIADSLAMPGVADIEFEPPRVNIEIREAFADEGRPGLPTHMKPSEALASNRAAIRHVVESHRARNARVFGSVLHGQDTDSSDLDLLIDPTPETTLFDISAISVELSKLLGVPVDVLTPNGLPDKFRAKVLAEAKPV